MDNRPVGIQEFNGRKEVVDERFREGKERLDKHEASIGRAVDLLAQGEEMLKRHAAAIDEHEKRLALLERQPAETWNRIKTTVVTATVTSLVALLVGLLVNMIE